MRCNWAGLDSHKNVGQSVCECGSISPRESQVVGVSERKLGDNFTVIFRPKLADLLTVAQTVRVK